jgi:hypothetical protein
MVSTSPKKFSTNTENPCTSSGKRQYIVATWYMCECYEPLIREVVFPNNPTSSSIFIFTENMICALFQVKSEFSEFSFFLMTEEHNFRLPQILKGYLLKLVVMFYRNTKFTKLRFRFLNHVLKINSSFLAFKQYIFIYMMAIQDNLSII